MDATARDPCVPMTSTISAVVLRYLTASFSVMSAAELLLIAPMYHILPNLGCPSVLLPLIHKPGSSMAFYIALLHVYFALV